MFDQLGVNVLQKRQIVLVDRFRSVFLLDLFDDVQQIFRVDLDFNLKKIDEERFQGLVQRGGNRIEIRFQIVGQGRARRRLPNELRKGKEEKGLVRAEFVHVD